MLLKAEVLLKYDVIMFEEVLLAEEEGVIEVVADTHAST